MYASGNRTKNETTKRTEKLFFDLIDWLIRITHAIDDIILRISLLFLFKSIIKMTNSFGRRLFSYFPKWNHYFNKKHCFHNQEIIVFPCCSLSINPSLPYQKRIFSYKSISPFPKEPRCSVTIGFSTQNIFPTTK